MPQIKECASPAFLRNLAVAAFCESDFSESPDVKMKVLSSIMSAAISRVSFNEPNKPASEPVHPYCSSQHPATSSMNPNLLNAEAFLRACLGRFDDLAGVILNHVADISSLSAYDARKQVKEVMLPVLQIVAEHLQDNINPTILLPAGINELLRIAVTSYVKIIAEHPYEASRESIRALVWAVTLPGGAEFFATPYVYQFDISESVFDDLMFVF